MYFHFYLCIFILNDRSNDKARHIDIDVASCIVVVYDATAQYSPSLSTKNVGEINPPSKGSE